MFQRRPGIVKHFQLAFRNGKRSFAGKLRRRLHRPQRDI